MFLFMERVGAPCSHYKLGAHVYCRSGDGQTALSVSESFICLTRPLAGGCVQALGRPAEKADLYSFSYPVCQHIFSSSDVCT